MSTDHFDFILRILKLQNSPNCYYLSINIRPLVEMSYRLIRAGGIEDYSYWRHSNYGALKDMHGIMRFCHGPAGTPPLPGANISFCGHAKQL